ncbi:hypothetical protein GOL41_26765 [Sinorhizobium medicae]|nr:hypothetical protein [Sinorhizobium medicae]
MRVRPIEGRTHEEAEIYGRADYCGAKVQWQVSAYHISVPDLGRDLKSMGFNLVSRANNHSLHWGVEGMRETSRLLDENGITHAGVGENLSQAAAPRFVETAKGRAALVSFATTFMPVSGLRFCGRGTRSTRCERASFDAKHNSSDGCA